MLNTLTTTIATIYQYVPTESWILLTLLTITSLTILAATKNKTLTATIWAAGIIPVMTLTPGPGPTTGTCQNLTLHSLLHLQTLLNLTLTIPLGIIVGYKKPKSLPIAALAILTVEIIQLAPDLGRTCQEADLLANQLGLAAGFVAGYYKNKNRTARHNKTCEQHTIQTSQNPSPNPRTNKPDKTSQKTKPGLKP